MQFLFILTAIGSFTFGFLGLCEMQNRDPSAEPAIGMLQLWMGFGGVVISAALFFLCGYMQQRQKQWDELSRTVRHLQIQADKAHEARKLPPR